MTKVFRPPFSKRVAVSKGMSLDVLRTSSRTIAMGEIPYAQRAPHRVNFQYSPADGFEKRGMPCKGGLPLRNLPNIAKVSIKDGRLV